VPKLQPQLDGGVGNIRAAAWWGHARVRGSDLFDPGARAVWPDTRTASRFESGPPWTSERSV